MATQQLVKVDDRDASIKYSGTWNLGGDAAHEYLGTTHGASANGSSLTFKFTGTSVSVFGTLPTAPGDSGTTAVYQLDASTPANVVTPGSDTTVFQHVLFSSPTLEDGEHTLTVTAASVTNATWFWVDFMEYTPSAANGSASTSTAFTSTSVPPAAAQSSGMSTALTSPTVSPASPSATIPATSAAFSIRAVVHPSTMCTMLLLGLLLADLTLSFVY